MLQGIRIVEIEGIGPGPFAAMTLADLGAEVIVIHRPEVPEAKGHGGPSLLDRGKKSVTLDLKDPAQQAQALALIARADGLIEGFRPGVMERLGLGPEACHAANPALVYGRMTGWGQEGPRAQQAGHDLNYIGVSGALWYAALPGQPPVTPPTLVGDIGGGALYLAMGMLAGLLKARATGRGSVVDAAIVDGSAHMMNLLMSMAAQGGLSTERGKSMLDGPHWSRSYLCADGGWMAVQALEAKFYALFLDRMGLSEDADFIRQHDSSLWPRLAERLEALFARHPRSHWEALFDGLDACAAPVLSPRESAADPHMSAREIWAEGPGGLQAAPAPRFDGQRATPADPPERGQHQEEILALLAQDAAQ
ncbi:CaiB/BaiF CoA transferase family protein [Pseudooceanicola aestuarii]|uniref:CaiB/BaiF CoA transferase family protein n=1 Tax=Pseudooceanicola aestuarii TaxID=2697319 RepID=UPI0013D6C201|nr:CaiB/BaiF CoA-transferase family protein [Pseudooceanicola aestuarii]